MKKRILAALAALTLSTSLTACGGEEPQTQTESTTSPAEQVAAAADKMRAAANMSVDMTQDIGLSITVADQSQEMNTNTQITMDIFQQPLKAKGSMTIDLGEDYGGTQSMDLYLMTEDEMVNMYLGMDGNWTRQTVAATDLGQYDTAQALELYLDSAGDFTAAGTEQIGGADASKFTGIIQGDKLSEVLTESGMLDALGQSGLAVSEDDVKSMLSDLGDLPMTVWINQDGYPVQYDMDMTQMLDSILTKTMELAGADEQGVTMNVSKATVSMTCSNFDAVEDFELPAEAQGAPEIAA